MRYDFVNLITVLSLYKSKRIKNIVFIGKFALHQAPVHFSHCYCLVSSFYFTGDYNL